MSGDRAGVPAQDPDEGPLSDPATLDAVQAALAAEHAAIWGYGLVSAYLPPSAAADVAAAARRHRERRDTVVALLERAGVVPVPAAAAYRTPGAVTDATTAAALAVVAEEDVAAAWRAVCERAEDPGADELRRPGVDAVVASAEVGVRWRRLAGTEPAVPAFPGTIGS